MFRKKGVYQSRPTGVTRVSGRRCNHSTVINSDRVVVAREREVDRMVRTETDRGDSAFGRRIEKEGATSVWGIRNFVTASAVDVDEHVPFAVCSAIAGRSDAQVVHVDGSVVRTICRKSRFLRRLARNDRNTDQGRGDVNAPIFIFFGVFKN